MLNPQRFLLTVADSTPVGLAAWKKSLCALPMVVLLAGCAQSPFSSQYGDHGYVLSGDTAKPIQNATLNGFLEKTPGNSVVTAASSPWGNDVEVTAESSYFAASGRECRKLRIVTVSQNIRQALVCRTDSGWAEQRLVTQTAEGRK